MKKASIPKTVYSVARFFVKPYVRRKYQFTTEKLPSVGEPFILLSNHTTEDDMLFTALASRQPMSFVCGEHLLRNRLYGKLLRSLVNPIPLPKGGESFGAVREILKRLKAGENVCMFPEGKRSYHGETIPCAVATGKLVKKAGCALVTYRIRGGYFTYPRWARRHHRKGRVTGEVVGIYSSEQLSGLSAREITDIINRDTYENAYDTQRENRWLYTGENRAEGLEHILFLCPRCHGMDTIRTEGDAFRCTGCDLHGVYTDRGFLEGPELPFDNVLSWMRWMEPVFDDFVRGQEPGSLLFTEPEVLLYRQREDYKNEDIARAELRIYGDKMVLGNLESSAEFREFRFEDISALSVLYGNIVLFTHRGVYYGLTGESLHAWKCARLWHLFRGDTTDPTKEI